MLVIEKERIVPFDVDDTLVMHDCPHTTPYQDTLTVFDHIEGRHLMLRINQPIVRLLKEESARGSFIVVWSRGGYQWALDIVRGLNLEKYVDLVQSKPLTYVDDTPIEEWIKDRVWLSPDKKYKLGCNQ